MTNSINKKNLSRLSIFSIITTIFLCAAYTPAFSQIKPIALYLGGGSTVPTSERLEFGWKTGWHLEGAVGLSIGLNVEIMAKVAYHSLSADKLALGISDGGRFVLRMYGADLKYRLSLPLIPASIYGLGGVGIARLEVKEASSLIPESFFDDPKDHFFINIGAGLEISRYFAQIRIVRTRDEGITYAYFPFTIGMKL